MLINLIPFITVTIVVSLAVSFIYLLFQKWGVWEYLQVHADSWVEKATGVDTDLLNRAFSCIFCTIWWVSVIFCLFLLVITEDYSLLLVPFCSTPLSRRITL